VRRLPPLFFAVLAAGCAFGGDEGAIEAESPATLVLQPSDLPGFAVDSSTGGIRHWTTRYRRLTAARTGLLAVESTVEISSTSNEAEARFSAARAELPESGGWQPIGEPGLGAESFASTRVGEGARSYEVVFRDANVTASVRVNGREGRLAFAEALALAEKQERQISDAKRKD
jgi:hypothetical protein